MNRKEKFDFGIAEVDHQYSGDDLLEIAKIIDRNTGNTVMRIIYDKYNYINTNFHICVCMKEDAEYGWMPYVFVDDEHKACLYEKPYVFQALMLHELGHFRNGDFENTTHDITASDIRRQRKSFTTKGIVQEQELKADAFAVMHVGKNTMLRALDYLINKRKKRTNDPGKELAIREFELRKKAIQNR